MRRRSVVVFAVAALTLIATACDASSTAARAVQLQTVPSPVIPATAKEFANPLRGQYEDLLIPLFPQGNPAQRGYPAWPRSYDASMRVSWRQLQPTPDTYDFSAIDSALAQLGARGMRLTLRVYAYNSCCDPIYPNNTNIAIPDWLRGIPGAAREFTSPNGVTQVVPNWNSPEYLAGFERLLSALGARYDGDERLSVFEFSGYGDFSENHIAYLRDVLAAPGPDPDDSMSALGYFSQYRDQSITSEAIRRLVAANVAAFARTQLVVTPQNPEIVRQMLADSVTARLAAPVGIRSDCLGVDAPLPAWAREADSPYVHDDDGLVSTLRQRFSSALVITEWCQLPAGADRRDYYDKGLRDVVAYHASMTSSVNFPDREATTPMDPELFSLWSRANVYAGYRYSVEAASGTQSNAEALVDVRWTNIGAAAATEKWAAGYRVVDSAGTVVRTMPAAVDLKKLVGEPAPGADQPTPASETERLRIDLTGLPPGRYTVAAAITWQQHKPNASRVVDYPPMELARDGRDRDGWYPVATLDVGQ